MDNFLENLVPNIVIEMSFILQLLTVEVNSDVEKGIFLSTSCCLTIFLKGKDNLKPYFLSSEATTKGILSGHHNSMYYATVALQKLFG